MQFPWHHVDSRFLPSPIFNAPFLLGELNGKHNRNVLPSCYVLKLLVPFLFPVSGTATLLLPVNGSLHVVIFCHTDDRQSRPKNRNDLPA